MGFLRKIGRKIDRGIRKVFGKNGWLKAAATDAALYFVGPQAISKSIGRVGTAVKEGANFVATAGTGNPNAFTSMTDSVSNFMSTARTAFTGGDILFPSSGGASNFPLKDFANSFKFFGTKQNPTFLPYGQELQDMGADLAKQGAASVIVSQATGGDDEFVGSTKGVQSVPMQEAPSYMNQLDNFIQTSPTQLPTISLANIPPVYAKLS